MSSFADSGFGSGGSDTSKNWRESERTSIVDKDDYGYLHVKHVFAAKGNGSGHRKPACSNENDPIPLYVDIAKPSSVDIVSEPKGIDAFKQSDESSGIRKKLRHYEIIFPDNMAGQEINASEQVNTALEEIYAKEIEPSNTQEAEGAVGMRSLAQYSSFASIKSDQGESVEDFYAMACIISHDSHMRNVSDNVSYLNKGRCRDSSSSSSVCGSTPIDTPARLTENFEEIDYFYTENQFDKKDLDFM
ncbi:uncharacterized protein LOC132730009 [Ruditapes philippinarum]|uniref:uncharacterized protein LOC132730009 n=1 Tax=Ruditapes philippinarum TaxID=129788 RepID=UPI00295A859E|nr:uncharacterized protein LOC132730009 [Ruditapes philippinarum]